MGGTYLNPNTLYKMQQLMAAVKNYSIVFWVFNLIAFAYMLFSIIRWKARTKDAKKITNKYNENGEESSAVKVSSPVSVVFVIVICAIDLFWFLCCSLI